MTKGWIQRREFLRLLGATAFASGLSRRVFAEPASAGLNFGFQNTSWGAVAMVAESAGTFRKAGAAVTPYRFDSGKSTRDAMVAGRIDIGVLGATPFIIGAAKGDMMAIAVAMYAGKTDSVVARVKPPIGSVAQLKGKKVASQVGSATDNVFQNKILPKYGLSKSDVQIINMPFQNHIAALAAGSVDAFAGVEPFPSVAEVDGLGKVLVDYSQFDMLPVLLAANRSAVEGKRDAVIAFLRGWLAAIKLFTNSREQATRIVWNYFGSEGLSVSDRVIRLMLSKLDFNPDYVSGLPAYLTEQSKELIRQNQLAKMPDWNRLLNRELLEQAIKA